MTPSWGVQNFERGPQGRPRRSAGFHGEKSLLSQKAQRLGEYRRERGRSNAVERLSVCGYSQGRVSHLARRGDDAPREAGVRCVYDGGARPEGPFGEGRPGRLAERPAASFSRSSTREDVSLRVSLFQAAPAESGGLFQGDACNGADSHEARNQPTKARKGGDFEDFEGNAQDFDANPRDFDANAQDFEERAKQAVRVDPLGATSELACDCSQMTEDEVRVYATQLQSLVQVLLRNMRCLYATARAEIERKDKRIALQEGELRLLKEQRGSGSSRELP